MRGNNSHEAPVSAAMVPAVSKKLLLYSITSLRLSTIVCAVGGSMVMARFLMNMVHEPFSPTLSFAFRVWVLWQKELDGATLIVRKDRGSLPVSHLRRCRPWSPAQEQIKGTDMDITLSWWTALLGLALGYHPHSQEAQHHLCAHVWSHRGLPGRRPLPWGRLSTSL